MDSSACPEKPAKYVFVTETDDDDVDNDDSDRFDDVCVIVVDHSADTTILQMAVDARRAAEVAVKQLLCQADGCPSGCSLPSAAGSPWEDLSSSRTAR